MVMGFHPRATGRRLGRIEGELDDIAMRLVAMAQEEVLAPTVTESSDPDMIDILNGAVEALTGPLRKVQEALTILNRHTRR